MMFIQRPNRDALGSTYNFWEGVWLATGYELDELKKKRARNKMVGQNIALAIKEGVDKMFSGDLAPHFKINTTVTDGKRHKRVKRRSK